MDKELREKGLSVRTAVLGKEYVRRAMEDADEFSRPLQDLLNEYCWGAVWGREGLSRKSRSILTLGMLSALNRSQELKTHIRGALNNGLTREEIREVFLQVGIYCGAPAGVEAFRCAREVFAEIDASTA